MKNSLLNCSIHIEDLIIILKGSGRGHGGAGLHLDWPLHGWVLRVRRCQPGVQLAPPPHGHLPRLPLWQWHPRVQGGQVKADQDKDSGRDRDKDIDRGRDKGKGRWIKMHFVMD